MARSATLKQAHVRKIAAIMLAGSGLACAAEADSTQAEPFQEVAARFEQNATDVDVEAVFTVTSGDLGLMELTIVGPDGRTVTDFKAPDVSTMGIRSFQLESPEPTDIEGLKAAYPAGVYRFSGKTVSGDNLISEARLDHDLPSITTIVNPVPESENVSYDNLVVSWNAVAGVAHYLVEVEQEDADINLSVRLPGTQTTFPLPRGFLTAGTEYKISIGTVMQSGNTSFVETVFTTGM